MLWISSPPGASLLTMYDIQWYSMDYAYEMQRRSLYRLRDIQYLTYYTPVNDKHVASLFIETQSAQEVIINPIVNTFKAIKTPLNDLTYSFKISVNSSIYVQRNYGGCESCIIDYLNKYCFKLSLFYLSLSKQDRSRLLLLLSKKIQDLSIFNVWEVYKVEFV
jgi:hypothetical protein